jgi:hypothetical protein
MSLLALILAVIGAAPQGSQGSSDYQWNAFRYDCCIDCCSLTLVSTSKSFDDDDVITACLQVQPVWGILGSTKAKPPATVIGANVSISGHISLENPASVGRICASILNGRLKILDRALQAVDAAPGLILITWELDLPDRTLIKYPGKHYQILPRKE